MTKVSFAVAIRSKVRRVWTVGEVRYFKDSAVLEMNDYFYLFSYFCPSLCLLNYLPDG